MVLKEFDPSQKAVINAEDFVDPIAEMPETAVACYSRITMERMVEDEEKSRDAFVWIWNVPPMQLQPDSGEENCFSFSMRRIIWTRNNGI